MSKNTFIEHTTNPYSEKWNNSLERINNLDNRQDEIRSEFWRDYNRILHSKGYRRLKHKTQVFHTTTNDHICTRIEHVGHVVAVSYTICNYLGLNTELSSAIALGHDLGHPPFGHDGEKHISDICEAKIGNTFWHEKNSLHFIDNIETLRNSSELAENLNLSYAVRDGIISHCGEVNENAIKPRIQNIDLNKIERPNQYQPYTWEGCVVKIADKISYLGRDIEDALRLKILNQEQINELIDILKPLKIDSFKKINNTILIHNFVVDLCNNSSPEMGIGFSEPLYQTINKIKIFNYKNIYLHPRIEHYTKFSKLIIETIFQELETIFDSNNLEQNIKSEKLIYPKLIENFENWLIKYSNYKNEVRIERKYNNKIIYNISKNIDYQKAIIDYISSMTDIFALNSFNDLLKF